MSYTRTLTKCHGCAEQQQGHQRKLHPHSHQMPRVR